MANPLLIVLVLASTLSQCAGVSFLNSTAPLALGSPFLTIHGADLDQLTSLDFNTGATLDTDWVFQTKTAGSVRLQLLEGRQWGSSHGASLTLSSYTAGGSAVSTTIPVASLTDASFVSHSTTRVAAGAQILRVSGAGFGTDNSTSVQLVFTHEIAQGRRHNFSAYAISNYELQAVLTAPVAVSFPFSPANNLWKRLHGNASSTVALRSVVVNGVQLLQASEEVTVATITPQPVVHETHTLLHPLSAQLHIQGAHLGCETEPFVQLSVPLTQGVDFTIGGWNNNSISLSLVSGKDWLAGANGSAAIQLVRLQCNQADIGLTTEVAVCINTCAPDGDAATCKSSVLRGGVFVADGSANIVRQAVGSEYGAVDTVSSDVLVDFAQGSFSARGVSKGMTLDRDLGLLYVSMEAPPGTSAFGQVDATGVVQVFDPVQKSAASQGRLGIDKLRSPRGLALLNQYAYHVQLYIVLNYNSEYKTALDFSRMEANLVSDLALTLQVQTSQVQDLWAEPFADTTLCQAIPASWDSDYKARIDYTLLGSSIKCTTLHFRVITDTQRGLAAMQQRLQDDIRSQDGQFNRYSETPRHHHMSNGLDFVYRARMYHPTFVPVFEPMTSHRKKHLFVASEHMDCLVRLKFEEPDNRQSGVIIAPHPYYDQSPYTCNSEGLCEPTIWATPAPTPPRPVPPPAEPTYPPPPPPVCLDSARKEVACTCTGGSDSCLKRDSEMCFTEISGRMGRPYDIAWNPWDWDRLYVTSELHGHVLQLDVNNGSAMGSSNTIANHAMGVAMYGYRYDYGTCRDDAPTDGKFHCTGPRSVKEGANMPADNPSVPCFVDSECQPNRINSSFVIAESVKESCDYQAVARMRNSTERILGDDGRPVEGQGEGQVILALDGWLRDAGLKQSPRGVQVHPSLGLLVSSGSRVLRYDVHTGDFKQVLVDLGADGEVSSFLVE